MKKHYSERDLIEMDRAGNHYGNHVMAMTAEQLHSKSDIAAELGWRDMQIAELKAQRDALTAEIARRDEIFIPLYPDENLMNKLTDVFHDTAKLEFTEDDVYVGNPELVISALINNFLLHAGQAHTMTLAYLNSVRADSVEDAAKRLFGQGYTFEVLTRFAAQLRAGEPS